MTRSPNTSDYVCPTCGYKTNQPSRTADAGVVRCLQLNDHKDGNGRNMKKVK
jgi:hypothetical protein